MAQVDIIIEDSRWDDAALEHLAQQACSAVFLHLDIPASFEVSILGCNDSRIAELNNVFRAKASATNVLSWPSAERAPDMVGGTPDAPDPSDPELGDIAIAFETCAREAADQVKSFEHHVLHLLAHGVLHLLGYDHETDQDAALMEGIETQILAKLGVADPY